MAFLVCAGVLCAQAGDDVDSARARASIERLRELVAAGAAPRAQLERAEAALDDAADAAILRRTIYGSDLTEDQIDGMLAAARRRVDRREKELAHARELVREQVASEASLGTYLDELDRSNKEYDLAVSRANLCRELTLMAQAEESYRRQAEEPDAGPHPVAERFDGSGAFRQSDFRKIESAFEKTFSKALPVSAMGETAVHRALGFDHRGRVDVAVHPDQPEGIWLRRYLTENGIPYFAFRQAVPGKATGAHIHIGPMSTHLAAGAAGS